ncbi:MAG: FN3 domain-containing metallophosphoesterase family protein [Phycisphaerales bacterium]
MPSAFSQDAAKLDIVHGPHLQAVTDSSATIVWVTNKSCVSKVEYEPCDSNEALTAVASRNGLIDANTRIHRITLSGLKPGVRYAYHVVSTEIVKFDPYAVRFGDTITAGPYRVQTWDSGKDRFSFCIVNDIHEKADRLGSLLDLVPLDAMDMVVFNGDMIDHWTREDQVFDGFLDLSVKRFARETAFVYVRGNHETRGALARDLLDLFPTPGGRYYYAFRHGPVAFLVLDSGEDKADTNKEYSGLVSFDAYMAEQTQWLRGAVREESFRKSRYRIVLVHMPPLGDGRGYGMARIRDSWSPILNEANIDLAFCGHTHRFARIDPNESANHYPILINAPDMVVGVDVTKDRLNAIVKKVDGQIVDTVALKPRRAD